MDKAKKKHLEKKGWKIGTVTEFLNRTPDEAAFIELKIALARNIRTRREQQQMTQTDVARLLKSSQSRIAKIEAGDASVSLDLMIRSLIALDATRREVAQAIAGRA